MATVTPLPAVWAVATRVSVLDANGFVNAGVNTFTTTNLLKATITPVVVTGDDIEIKNAAGDLGAWAKHGDMIKYGTVNIELTVPDPQLEQACCGGVLFSDVSVALGAPTGLTLTANTTLGTLISGTYGYRATQYNAYGESVAQTEVTTAVTGPTGSVVVSGVTATAGAIGIAYYGRTPGGEQLLGRAPLIGSQTTNAASGTGTVTSIVTQPLTKPIPAGFQFQILPDTNTPKIVFTTTAPSGVGAIALTVSASASVSITIATGGAITPCFFDTGATVPSGAVPTTDLSAGPGTGTGYQASTLGIVGNPNGVSMEFWEKRISQGQQATDWPYWRYVLPRVQNMHTLPHDITNANLQTIMEGQAFQNPNWGSGPDGSWNIDTTKWRQRQICGVQVIPAATPVAVPAQY